MKSAENTTYMKKLHIILILALLMLVSGNAQAQGRKKIRIMYRKARHLVEKIEANPNAETLYLFRNGLDSLPEEIGQLKHLKKLVVSSNRLTYIPPVIGELTELKELNVAGSGGLLVIPNMINCQMLERLYIDNTTLFDASFNPRSIPNLKIYIDER